jgi:hypothetical protein
VDIIKREQMAEVKIAFKKTQPFQIPELNDAGFWLPFLAAYALTMRSVIHYT